MTELSKKDWLDYINRLQERERQKITSGGITNWSLFLSIGGLAYWLFPELPKIRGNIDTVILGFLLFMNLTLTIFDLFNTRFRIDKIIKYRTKSQEKLGSNIAALLKTYEIIISLITVVCSVYLIFIRSPFFICIFILLLLRHYPSIKPMLRVKRKIEETEISELSDSERKEIIKIKLVFSTILFSVSLYPFLHVFFFLRLEINQLKLALYGLIMVLVLLMFQFLFVIFAKRMKIGWLEDLEKTVLLNKLNDSSIKNKLEKEYFSLSRIDDYF
jgi:hypothetical protein